MKLTDVIAILNNTYKGYCDFESAIEKVVGIENDVDSSLPRQPNP